MGTHHRLVYTWGMWCHRLQSSSRESAVCLGRPRYVPHTAGCQFRDRRLVERQRRRGSSPPGGGERESVRERERERLHLCMGEREREERRGGRPLALWTRVASDDCHARESRPPAPPVKEIRNFPGSLR
jgi:hypothetical protein